MGGRGPLQAWLGVQSEPEGEGEDLEGAHDSIKTHRMWWKNREIHEETIKTEEKWVETLGRPNENRGKSFEIVGNPWKSSCIYYLVSRDELEQFWDRCLASFSLASLDGSSLSPEEAAELVAMAQRHLDRGDLQRASELLVLLGPLGAGAANGLVAALERHGPAPALLRALAALRSPAVPAVRALLRALAAEDDEELRLAVVPGCFALRPPAANMPGTLQELLKAHEAVEVLGATVARQQQLEGSAVVGRLPKEELLILVEKRHSSAWAVKKG